MKKKSGNRTRSFVNDDNNDSDSNEKFIFIIRIAGPGFFLHLNCLFFFFFFDISICQVCLTSSLIWFAVFWQKKKKQIMWLSRIIKHQISSSLSIFWMQLFIPFFALFFFHKCKTFFFYIDLFTSSFPKYSHSFIHSFKKTGRIYFFSIIITKNICVKCRFYTSLSPSFSLLVSLFHRPPQSIKFWCMIFANLRGW